jgi:hypothetical protein
MMSVRKYLFPNATMKQNNRNPISIECLSTQSGTISDRIDLEQK